MPKQLLLYASVLLVSGCMKSGHVYSGPRRPASEVAIIQAVESSIDEVDGVNIGSHHQVEVLPGEHAIGITLEAYKYDPEDYRYYTRYRSNAPYSLCMKVEAGKTYLVRIEMEGAMWRPHVQTFKRGERLADLNSSNNIATPCEGERRAAVLYGQLCSEGEPRSCFTLGMLYKDGSGVPQDERRAATLFGQACEGGVGVGCNSLGVLYREGRGVAKDEGQAATLFEKACTGEATQGCFNLGLQYVEGRVVPRDERRAATLFDKACTGEVAPACLNLGVLYREGRGVPRDERRAAALFATACEGGMSAACGR